MLCGSAQAETSSGISDSLERNTMTYKGMKFPKVGLPDQFKSIAAGGSVCEIGETRTQTQNFSHHGLYKQKKSWSDTRQHSFFSPNFWVTDSGSVTLTSRGLPASFSPTVLQSNMTFNTNSEYNTVQSSLNSYVASLDIPDTIKADINIQLQEFISNFQSYTNAISSSHGGFQVTTTVGGTGRLNFNTGHAWIEGRMVVQQTCVPPELTNPGDLEQKLKLWIDDTASDYPNTTTGTVLVGTIMDRPQAEIISGTIGVVGSRQGEWTKWLNRDRPGGNGDFDTLAGFRQSGQACETPIEIECRTSAGKVPHNQTGEVYSCAPQTGGACVNRQQSDGRCQDYEVRFKCP
ncbi:MAG: hypothetical protein AAFR74_07355 [Pseudomonadota bacterium]